MNDFKSLRIVFMGTPEFAVASLETLIKEGCQVVGVVTAPDKPAGRGMKLNISAVKKYALEHGLKILQPQKLKDPEFLEELRSLHADLQIVVAFRMLPEVVWNMPPMGSVNLHGSLLPQYRGAAPINWAVINGERETGVTTFKLRHEIDTGDILMQEKFPIGENETAGELHDRMKEIGAALLLKTVKGLAEQSLREISQDLTITNMRKKHMEYQPADHTKVVHTPVPSHASENSNSAQLLPLKHAPKISAATCKIDFTKPVSEVYNLIRGLSPIPGAFTELNGKILKIYRSEKEEFNSGKPGNIKPGEIRTDSKTYLKFGCADGFLIVKELQLEGKKKMLVEEFLRGNKEKLNGS